MEEERKTVGAKVTPKFYDLIQRIVKEDTHLSIGEVIRQALREWIKKNHPDKWEDI